MKKQKPHIRTILVRVISLSMVPETATMIKSKTERLPCRFVVAPLM